MLFEQDLQQLNLTTLKRRCAEETEQFFNNHSHDPRYGYELFRRAVVARNADAWEGLYQQYQPLVIKWVRSHPAFAASGEEDMDFVNKAFAKIWGTMTPDKFDQFSTLSAILQYLKMCVHSVIIDFTRKRERVVQEVETDFAQTDLATDETTVEEQVLQETYREQFWQALNRRLKSQEEQLVLYESFVLALKPREIQARYPDIFQSIKEVYRTKENVTTRLRRDVEFHAFSRADYQPVALR